ncbi:hypothetical protein ACFQ8C_14395 [Streptomyces sp. NPDC056503]|uniref:hypothetical protein n=1 Tax=Streptomyces sp. NPDC056503 TaxID=3345842 RepID=UPI00367D0B36
MGIESDRMVFDYLSEVGDLAQQRHLPPGDRTALVAGLRNEIDRRRATHGEESPTAVRGILGDLGTPDEVVTRATGRDPEPEPEPEPQPQPRPGGRAAWWSDAEPDAPARPPAKSPKSPKSSKASAPVPPQTPVPHPRSGDVELPGWWGDGAGADEEPHVPGFFGGVEAPELFRPPEPEEEPEEEGPARETAPASRVRRAARLLLRRRPPHATEEAAEPEEGVARVAARGFAHPFLLLAALLLVAGAAFGWLIALALGWLVAYGSRRLTPGQVKTAVFVLPGLAAAGGVAWLWGRVEGRWGEAVAAGGEGMSQAVSDTWPWTLRAAALASAGYLLLRARRG